MGYLARRIVGTLISFVSGWASYAHEIETHKTITARAMEYLEDADENKYACAPKINAQLQLGAADEDAFFSDPNSFPLGRFYFHFFGDHSQPLDSLGQTATCISRSWGLEGALCTAKNSIPLPGLSTAPISVVNDHDWNSARLHARGPANQPSDQGWYDLGYVVHLLEDLTSPAHTRNDAHPCAAGLFICDPFEWTNKGRIPNMPITGSLLGDLPDPSTISAPGEFFNILQAFVRANFFSNGTVFDSSQPGPTTVIYEDLQYFYGPCLSGNDPACFNGARKIAHKNLTPRFANDRTKGFIDAVIAAEQFDELGPIITRYVAAYIDLYVHLASPQMCMTHNLTIRTSGTGHGTVTTNLSSGFACSAESCSIAVGDGELVTLNAAPTSDSTFVSWFSIVPGVPPLPQGSNNSLITTIRSDQTWEAVFTAKPTATITDFSCTQKRQGTIEQTISATGSVRGSGNTVFMIWLTSAGAFYDQPDLQIVELNCAGWPSDTGTSTCTQPLSSTVTTWSATTRITWHSSLPNPPPLTAYAQINYLGSSGWAPLLGQQLSCRPE